MSYLTEPETIKEAIDDLTNYHLLWMDTEIADWNTPFPRLSLIQILAGNYDSSHSIYIIDVLDKSELIDDFVQKIMINNGIEKVFHNAAFDVKYLGGKNLAKNVTCTLKIARKINKYRLGTPNLKLKTLARCLCGFDVELNEQGSDWSQRPLTDEQLEYARLDVIYLSKVHRYLLNFRGQKRMDIIEGISSTIKNITTANKGRLYEATIDFLNSKNWRFEEDRDKSIITLIMGNKDINWSVLCLIEEGKKQLTVLSKLPVAIPPGQVKSLIDYLFKKQEEIEFGKFLLDDDETGIFFETTIVINNENNKNDLLDQVFYGNFAVVAPCVTEIREIIREKNINVKQFNDVLGITAVTEELAEEYSPIFLDKHPESLPTPEIKPPREIKALSIKDISLAYECPRLFYLVYRQGRERNFILDQDSAEANNLFNQVSSQLLDSLQQDKEYSQLFALKSSELNSEELTLQLKNLLYKQCFFPYIQSQTKKQPQKAPLLLQTWEAITPLLKRWTDILISNRRSYSPQELFDQTFIYRKNSDRYFPLPDNQQQLIRGKFDNCLYQKDKSCLFIINHQSEKSLNPEAQLVEVALSSYLIKDLLGLEIDNITYLLFPNCQQFNYPWSQIEQTVDHLIKYKILELQSWLAWETSSLSAPPKTTYQELCEICPQQAKCQSLFPTLPTDKTPPQPRGENNPVIIIPEGKPIKTTGIIDENMGKDLVSTLNAFGLKVDYLETVAAPSFYRIKIKPKPGVKAVSIINRSQDLQVQLGIIAPPIIQAQAGFVSVDIPRDDRQIAHFKQYISSCDSQEDEEFKIAIGVDLEGKLVEADLADPSTCHFLVGGTTGSGKSEFLRALLLSLMVRHKPQFLQIAIVDPKRVTFPEFDNLPWLLKPVIKEQEDAINLIEELVFKMEERYKILENNNCNDLKSYNLNYGYANGSVIPRIVCIFDEYADFMADKSTRQFLETGIKSLGAKARAAGIHLIIGTQRPDATVVTPLIRSNLPGRVALKTASETDSTIIFGNKEKSAAYLLGKGDLLYLRGATAERLQSLYVENLKFN
jgi:S-DNA-T family DNA segregation ATPase FtsK/SpoIIIE